MSNEDNKIKLQLLKLLSKTNIDNNETIMIIIVIMLMEIVLNNGQASFLP